MAEQHTAERISDQLRRLSAGLTGGQKVGLVVMVAVVLAGFAGIIGLAGRPDWRPLFTQLDPSDAAAITERLTADGVEYRLERGGTAVMVAAEQVDELRIRLSAAGVLHGDKVGFDLLSESDPWSGRQEQEARRRLALEAVLRSSIASIQDLRGAKVHIALPRESLFVDRDRPPSASVLVFPQPGRTLTRSQVDGIGRLVASAVEGMKPENVSVLDADGNLLSKRREDMDTGSALEYRAKVENELEEAARSILDPLVGAGHAMVTVRADVDFSRVRETQEEFDDDKVVVTREQRTTETRDTAGTEPRGIPGARAGEGMKTVGGGMASERKQEDVRYAIPKTTRTVDVPVGTVERLSVAVLVDGHYDAAGGPASFQPRTDAELQRYAELVKKAVGFSDARGDQIEVVGDRFLAAAPDEVVEVASGAPPWWPEVRALVPWAVLLLVALLLVLFAVRPLVRFVTSPAPAPSRAALTLGPGDLMGLSAGQPDMGLLADAPVSHHLPALPDQADPAAFIKRYAQADPTKVTHVLRRWIAKG